MCITTIELLKESPASNHGLLSKFHSRPASLVCLFVWVLVFQGRVSVCSPGCPGALSVALKLLHYYSVAITPQEAYIQELLIYKIVSESTQSLSSNLLAVFTESLPSTDVAL